MALRRASLATLVRCEMLNHAMIDATNQQIDQQLLLANTLFIGLMGMRAAQMVAEMEILEVALRKNGAEAFSNANGDDLDDL